MARKKVAPCTFRLIIWLEGDESICTPFNTAKTTYLWAPPKLGGDRQVVVPYGPDSGGVSDVNTPIQSHSHKYNQTLPNPQEEGLT